MYTGAKCDTYVNHCINETRTQQSPWIPKGNKTVTSEWPKRLVFHLGMKAQTWVVRN